jgi:hypothetical protein
LEGRYDEKGQPATPYSVLSLNLVALLGFFSMSAFHFMQCLGLQFFKGDFYHAILD